jgi:hypothetical protein
LNIFSWKKAKKTWCVDPTKKKERKKERKKGEEHKKRGNWFSAVV